MTSKIAQTYLNYEKHFDLPCNDIQLFQQRLYKLRQLDDKIIHILNAEIPTESFRNEQSNPKIKCTQFVDEVSTFYSQRESAINKCIQGLNNEISSMARDSSNYRSQLREKQFNLRLFNEELSVDTIIRARSLKAIEERCKPFY